MTKSFSLASASFAAVLALSFFAGTVFPAHASEEVPTTQDMEAARRCAADTRVAGYAFREVRDSVRAGGTTRAEALLTAAEDALMSARSSCRENAEVSAQLDALAGDAEGLRRSLSAAPR